MTIQPERLAAVVQGTLPCGPETLQINLGNACRLRCAFCWNHSPFVVQRGPAWHGQRLAGHHLQGLIQDLPRLRPDRVLLSGRGEPLLYPGLVPLLQALRHQRIPVTIQTGGADGPDPETLAGLGVDRLLVNLSAGSETGFRATHPDSSVRFSEVVHRLQRAVDAGIALALVAVVQKTNQDDLHALLDLAQTLRARLVLKGMEMGPGLERLCLGPEEKEGLKGRLFRLARRAAVLKVGLDTTHLAQLLRAQDASGSFSQDLRRGPCYMGWFYLRVTCDGRIMFCCKDKVQGHLDQASLYRIWRSLSYHLQRLAGRDGDPSTGLFDGKCRVCSLFDRNQKIHRLLGREGGTPAQNFEADGRT